MSLEISVIIPAFNEEDHIEDAIRSARELGATDVIVSDGGSDDDTAERAERAGARVVEGALDRGAQSNLGARASTGQILLFLHADTRLPPDAADAVRTAVEGGLDLGGFRVRFRERSYRLRLAATLINLRSRLTRMPWGDQAQFLLRDTFERVGGFREIPIMEDYDLAFRMRGRYRTGILPLYVTTSGRRFLERGVVRTAWMNWRTIVGWHLGASPESLARRYRSR